MHITQSIVRDVSSGVIKWFPDYIMVCWAQFSVMKKLAIKLLRVWRMALNIDILRQSRIRRLPPAERAWEWKLTIMVYRADGLPGELPISAVRFRRMESRISSGMYSWCQTCRRENLLMFLNWIYGKWILISRNPRHAGIAKSWKSPVSQCWCQKDINSAAHKFWNVVPYVVAQKFLGDYVSVGLGNGHYAWSIRLEIQCVPIIRIVVFYVSFQRMIFCIVWIVRGDSRGLAVHKFMGRGCKKLTVSKMAIG